MTPEEDEERARDTDATGYLHPAYAASLFEFGTPRALPACEGWVLERDIAGTATTGARDAMGCYPLFACRDWSKLRDDLETIEGELVSLALVTDPFGDYDAERLGECFPDKAIPFKEHFVVALDPAKGADISKHHRYYTARAQKQVEVERCADPSAFHGEWVALYANLAARHGLTGIKAFSHASFERQLRVPGCVVLRASHEGQTVGAHVWYVQNEVAYSHLAAVNERGYELMASYALYAFALDHFKDQVRWLDLGAGAGLDADAADGLTRFKRGWTTDTRTVYFCGRIFDRQRYDAILAARRIEANDYFPAYRKGEFG
ncbi:MAG TPA: GNAT family N-acetyltransferase [Pyrinomonadaceae bacterium]|nr:GNAT family N-acetyltransferase [Pyrinomonadaceae bacterium]